MNAVNADQTGADGGDEPDAGTARAVTWAALLGRWMDFARSAVALPTDDAGRRMRDSVPDVIMLQAVWFALRDLGRLPAAERALGLDRAEVLIQRHAATLQRRFTDTPMPRTMRELIADARDALAAAQRSRAPTDGSAPTDTP